MIEEINMYSQHPNVSDNQCELAMQMPLSVRLQFNTALKNINSQINPINPSAQTNDLPISTLTEDLRNIIYSARRDTQAPQGIILSSLLSVMSLSCQDVIDVKTPNGIVYPTSLFFITVAPSGERKSSVDNITTQAIIEKQQELEIKFDHECQQYEINMNVWNIEKKAQSDLLTSTIKSRGDCDEIRNGLLKIEERKPCKPKQTKWILSDVTSAAIKKSITTYGGSLGVFSDEAGSLFSGDFLRKTADLNSLWGAKPLNIERATSQSISDNDYRFGLSLMVQPEIFKDFLKKQGIQARSSGFFARCLISQPTSTQGTRFIVEDSSTSCTDKSTEIINSFSTRVSEFLQFGLNRRLDGKARECMSFSPEASKRWIAMYNQIEMALGESGILAPFSDFSSKFMEHVSRVAAVLEYFSSKNTNITDHTMFAAISIVEWYFSNFIKILDEKSTPDYIKNAEELKQWLQLQFNKIGESSIKKNTIRQFGPYCIRDKNKLNEALNHLKTIGFISVVSRGKTQYVEIPRYPYTYRGL